MIADLQQREEQVFLALSLLIGALTGLAVVAFIVVTERLGMRLYPVEMCIRDRVAIISGGAWLQFEKQVLSNLPQDERLTKLSILPTCGTQFFQYTGEWKRLYAEDFTADEKEKIVSSLNKAIGTAGFPVEKTWG